MGFFKNGGNMKDKRNILKLSCILEFIYIALLIVNVLFFTKDNEEKVANIFVCLVSFIITVLLYKESKKEIAEIRKNKIKIQMGIIWMFLYSIIPGILGFFFLSSISDNKKRALPVINEEKVTKKEVAKHVFVLIFFLFIMFIFPFFPLYDKIPIYFIYLLILIVVVFVNFKDLKSNFIIFIKNIKTYIPYVLNSYIKMLGIMIIVSFPIILLNNGQTSSNQEAINIMFQKLPLLTLLLSCLYAPLAEESVFRLTLHKLLSNKTIYIIISGFLFGILHLIDKTTSFYDLLYVFEYAALGMCLAKSYVDSKNIFVPISMHFIQNFIAALLVLALY